MARRILEGVIINNKSHKTVAVLVTRKVLCPRYRKFVSKSKKYMVHNEDNSCLIGDTIKIVESVPISKLKKWRVLEKVKYSNKNDSSK